MPDIDYERIVEEVEDEGGASKYLIRCLYEDNFDIHHRYTDGDEYEGEFNLLQLVAYYMYIEERPSKYFLIIEKLISKGLNLSDLPDDANATCFSYLCGSRNELPVDLIDLLVQHGAIINPPSIDKHTKIPLFEAATLGHVQTIRRLCEIGVNVHVDARVNDYETALQACLEVNWNEAQRDINAVHDVLFTLLEFNYKVSSDDFLWLCNEDQGDDVTEATTNMHLECIKACLEHASLGDMNTKPFFVENDVIENFINGLQDNNPIKQAIKHAQNIYGDWRAKILERHDCLRIIHSFFTIRDCEQVELAEANEHFENALASANKGLSFIKA
ncbi:MAG: hypothetical protein P1U36_07750 [Legionellaceae bacterium]|nr:hypothetical protein [Legionellaceae bacterium]